jgi:hypothetical protein
VCCEWGFVFAFMAGELLLLKTALRVSNLHRRQILNRVLDLKGNELRSFFIRSSIFLLLLWFFTIFCVGFYISRVWDSQSSALVVLRSFFTFFGCGILHLQRELHNLQD